MNIFRLTATYGVVFACFRYGVDGQVQTIDTISVGLLCLISLFVLLGSAYCVLVILTSPEVRQIKFTDGCVKLEQIGLIHDQYQLLFVRTTAYAQYLVIISAGLREDGISLSIGYPVCPTIG